MRALVLPVWMQPADSPQAPPQAQSPDPVPQPADLKRERLLVRGVREYCRHRQPDRRSVLRGIASRVEVDNRADASAPIEHLIDYGRD